MFVTNRDTFIVILHTILFVPDICDKLYTKIELMNQVHTYIFQKGVCMVYFGDKGGNMVALPHIAQRKHAFLGETKEMSKLKKISPRKKFSLK